MRFQTIFALLVCTAIASPTTPTTNNPADYPSNYENITINGLYVHTLENPTTSVLSVNFNLTGNNATHLRCHGGELDLTQNTQAVMTCSVYNKYRFNLFKGEKMQFALKVWHELGLGFGFSGQSDVFTYCHAGGNQTIMCTQHEEPIQFVIE